MAYMIHKKTAEMTLSAAKTTFYLIGAVAVVASVVAIPGSSAILVAALRRAGTNCLIGATLDLAIQYGINLLVDNPNPGENLNYTSARQSCIESAISINSTIWNIVFTSTSNCIVSGAFDNGGQLNDEFSLERCAQGALIAAAITLITSREGGGRLIHHIQNIPLVQQVKLLDQVSAFFQELAPNLISRLQAITRNSNTVVPDFRCGIGMQSCAFLPQVFEIALMNPLDAFSGAECGMWRLWKKMMIQQGREPVDADAIEHLFKVNPEFAEDYMYDINQLTMDRQETFVSNLFESGLFMRIRSRLLAASDDTRKDILEDLLDGPSELIAGMAQNKELVDAWQAVSFNSDYARSLEWLERINIWRSEGGISFGSYFNEGIANQLDENIVKMTNASNAIGVMYNQKLLANSYIAAATDDISIGPIVNNCGVF